MLDKMRNNKKIWFGIIAFQIVILALGAIVISRKQSAVEVNFTQDDLLYDSGEAGFYLDTSHDAYWNGWIATPDFVLPRGFYALEVECEYNGCGKVEVVYSDDKLNTDITGAINLSDSSALLSIFRTRYNNRNIKVLIRLTEDSESGDYILIRNIRIVTSPINLNILLYLFQAFGLFVIIDILLWIVCYRNCIDISEERKFHYEILFFLILILNIPLMTNYLTWAHDLTFHLTRIEGLKEELLNGSFPVRMQSFWLGGHGYPLSVFYGDIFLYIPVVFRILGMSVFNSYKIYVLLVNIGTVIISYHCFSKMSTAKIGLISTIVFSLNIYRLTDIYTRASVGEYTAIMFMPLVLYGMWSIYALPEESKEHNRSWLPLTVGCTGIFLSHVLSTEMVALFIILVLVVCCKKTFRKKTFLVLLKAAASMLVLNLWFLVPFLDYFMNANVAISEFRDSSVYFTKMGAFPAQLFMNTYHVDAGSSLISLGVAEDMPLTLGWASMLVLAGWLVCVNHNKRPGQKRTEEYFAVILCVLSLWMTLYCFPYLWLAENLSPLQMLFNRFEFPWRFFALAELFCAWLLCIILRVEWKKGAVKQIFVGVLLVVSLWQGISYMSDILNLRPPELYRDGFSTMHLAGGDYLPQGTDLEYIEEHVDELIYNEGFIEVSDWHRDKGAVEVVLINNGGDTEQVEVPVIFYKGYHAIVDNGDELEISAGTSNRISVSVPPGFAGDFRVEFREPWYWRVCEFISLITLLCLILWHHIRGVLQRYIKVH